MAGDSADKLPRSFQHFAEICARSSPLYAELSARVAEAPNLLAMAARGQPRQPPPNLLFGGVHYLLLNGADHPLRDFYPSIGGQHPASDAWPDFHDFCRAHEEAIVEQIAARRVQTNEVGRCGLLMPALSLVQREMSKPLFLIEVGASAGLNLFLDQFRYEYSNGRTIGGPSSVNVRVEVRGEQIFDLPESSPIVRDRVGIDVSPVDVMDDEAMRWIAALIWPEHVDRLELQRSARAVARLDPPRVIEGDGLELLPAIVDDVDDDLLPCVFHSHAIYQMDEAWRDAFHAQLDALGNGRDLAHVSLEWLGDDPGPQLHVTTWKERKRRTMHLADCHHHGRWIRPVDTESIRK